MLEIYGRANAWNVRKVLFLAEELGLQFKRTDYGRGFAPTNTPEFLALNPNGLVPVLVDGDAAIWESHAILRYMAAKFGPETMYPKDFVKRAHVDQWLDWKIATLSVPIRLLFFKHFLQSGDYTDKEVAEADAECLKAMTILDTQLGRTNAYIAGPDFTAADCAIGMAVHRWLSLPLTHGHLPRIDAYYKRLSESAAYRNTVVIGIP